MKRLCRSKNDRWIAGVCGGVAEYLGISSNGLGGRIMVKATIKDGKLSAIDVLESHESPEIGDVALNTQIPRMIERNSAEVDTVSGATITCNALSEAVAQAVSASRQ